MKRYRRFLSAVCAAVFLLAAVLPVCAAQTEDGYTYKIRIYSGKQGLIGGQEVVVLEGLKYGDRVTFYRNMVTLNNEEKYYIRGIRKSGEDNGEAEKGLEEMSFLVTQDQDYVVAYGILGDAVSYTIHYVDEDGDTLAPSETYYGNVGDKPVIAYLYIDGYRPNAYNLTKTLSKNTAENVFTFTYYRLSSESTGTGGTGTEGVTEAPVLDAGAVAPGTTAVPAAGAGGGGAVAAGGEAAAVIQDEEELTAVPDEDVPMTENLVDLDDEEVPRAEFPTLFDTDGNAKLLGIPIPLVLASGAVLIGGGILLLMFRKRKKKEGS